MYMYRVCVFLGVSMIYVCVHMGSLCVCGYMGCVYIDMVYVCVYVCVPMCGMYGVCVCVYVWGLCVCPGCVCVCLCVFLCMYVGWVRIDVLNEPITEGSAAVSWSAAKVVFGNVPFVPALLVTPE